MQTIGFSSRIPVPKCDSKVVPLRASEELLLMALSFAFKAEQNPQTKFSTKKRSRLRGRKLRFYHLVMAFRLQLERHLAIARTLRWQMATVVIVSRLCVLLGVV